MNTAGYWSIVAHGAAAIWLYAAVGFVLMTLGFFVLDWTTPGPLRQMVRAGLPNCAGYLHRFGQYRRRFDTYLSFRAYRHCGSNDLHQADRVGDGHRCRRATGAPAVRTGGIGGGRGLPRGGSGYRHRDSVAPDI